MYFHFAIWLCTIFPVLSVRQVQMCIRDSKDRGLSQLSRINEICVFCVNPRSGMCLLVKELISCQQQRHHRVEEVAGGGQRVSHRQMPVVVGVLVVPIDHEAVATTTGIV